MPRDGASVRKRLQFAALQLFQEAGYEVTTAAQIAAKAGVTERTFFRHFSDKREVLFDGEHLLSAGLVGAIAGADPHLGPWETLFQAFRAVEPFFIENRDFSEPRRRIIASSATLQERAQTKMSALVASTTLALSERGVPRATAALAAQIGIAALARAFDSWTESTGTLDSHLVQAFQEIRDLTTPLNSGSVR